MTFLGGLCDFSVVLCVTDFKISGTNTELLRGDTE
jgi:hypothetical protein